MYNEDRAPVRRNITRRFVIESAFKNSSYRRHVEDDSANFMIQCGKTLLSKSGLNKVERVRVVDYEPRERVLLWEGFAS